MKLLLTTICGVALFAAIAGAQTSSTTTTTTASSPAAASTTTTSSATESTGTITEFTPGSAIVLNTGASEPVRYKLGSSVTYINAKGKVIKAERIRKDRKVRVHYTKEGDNMVVDKVTVVRE